jgi:hypothetical protein
MKFIPLGTDLAGFSLRFVHKRPSLQPDSFALIFLGKHQVYFFYFFFL